MESQCKILRVNFAAPSPLQMRNRGCTVLHRPRYFAKLMLPLYRLECCAPLRRMEDKIRSLCQQIVAERDEKKATSLIVRLRDELHQHVEQFRARLGTYPGIIERRKLVHLVQPFPLCPICQESVELTTARTNEDGLALHDDCYIGILKSTVRSPQPNAAA